jgi:hypothetical protein
LAQVCGHGREGAATYLHTAMKTISFPCATENSGANEFDPEPTKLKAGIQICCESASNESNIRRPY